MNITWIYRSPFGRHGKKVVVSLCGWEVVAILAGLPTLSEIVKKYPHLGWFMLLLLAHHWYVERPDLVTIARS